MLVQGNGSCVTALGLFHGFMAMGKKNVAWNASPNGTQGGGRA